MGVCRRWLHTPLQPINLREMELSAIAHLRIIHARAASFEYTLLLGEPREGEASRGVWESSPAAGA